MKMPSIPQQFNIRLSEWLRQRAKVHAVRQRITSEAYGEELIAKNLWLAAMPKTDESLRQAFEWLDERATEG